MYTVYHTFLKKSNKCSNKFLTRTHVHDKIRITKEEYKMKELVQSKGMLAFMVIILGVTYLNCIPEGKLESDKEQVKIEKISMNVQ